MLLQKLFTSLTLLLSSVTLVHCGCYDPSPAFPPPKLHPASNELKQAFNKIEASIKEKVSKPQYDTTSFSLEITSPRSTLYSLHHTARQLSPTRPGTTTVNGSSAYRIASITKAFTVLSILQQHAKGTLHLDDPVSKYLPALSGKLPWHDITLRALGSQLSGIPGDMFQSELLTSPSEAARLGLPPKSKEVLPTCNEFHRACTADDLVEQLGKQRPLLAPAQRPSYCNVAFEILGLVLEKVTKMGYSEYIHMMLKEIGVEGITFDKPEDRDAVLPRGEAWYWDAEQGVERPTGGLYSGTTALSSFLRYVLTHYNGITTGALNWLHPASYSSGLRSFYGMPWEIFRSERILPNSTKPVTFVTKSGGVPGYTSIIILVPDYDLGITILVAGDGRLLAAIRQIVSAELIPAVEAIGQRQLKAKYTGTYTADGINSTLELSHSAESGLYVSRFISNSTDVLRALLPPLAGSDKPDLAAWRYQLVPTLLFAEPKNQKGEQWYAQVVPEKRGQDGLWDDFCVDKIDNGRYAGKTLNEMLVWMDGDDEVVEVELPAFEVMLKKQKEQKSSSTMGKLLGAFEQMQILDGVWS